MTLHVELVSPERVAYSGDARMVVARTPAGDIAFLTGHVPFIGTLVTHEVRVIGEDDAETAIAVHSGFVEVAPADDGHTKVTILSDVCELADDIDVSRAEAALERATRAVATDPDDQEAKAALARAELRMQVAAKRS